MSQIKKKFILNQAVDEQKILLLNNGALKSRNAANSADLDLLKLDGSNILTMLRLPRLDAGAAAVSNAKDLTSKEYVDGEITTNVTNKLGAVNGIATLDASGKLPSSQLTIDAFEYKGTWSAASNTPTLANGTGNKGDVYQVTAAGSVNFGAGAIAFEIGDKVVYNGTIWEKWDMTDQVASVNGYTGVVVLSDADIAVSPSIQGGSTVEGALTGLNTAVVALQGASVEFVQQKFTLSGTDITNGYINLANLAIQASINAFVDRLAIHETDDYTVSTVGGVTRMTFVGNLVTPSEQALAAGDVITVKYAKKPL